MDNNHTPTIDFNVDEYVSEVLAISEERPTARDLAESIADIAMAQGLCASFNGDFEAVASALLPQVEYYL